MLCGNETHDPTTGRQTALSSHAPASSVRDNCSFASDPKKTLRLEVSEVRLSSQKQMLCGNETHDPTTGRQTAASSHAPASSVRDNCSFASDPKKTLRLEVSEARLSSQKQGLCGNETHDPTTGRQTAASSHAPASSVRDNCSFASDPQKTLRLEVSEVRLSSQKQMLRGPDTHDPTTGRQTAVSSHAPASSVRDNCSFASDPKKTLRLEVSEVRLSSQKQMLHGPETHDPTTSKQTAASNHTRASPLRFGVSEVRLSSQKQMLRT